MDQPAGVIFQLHAARFQVVFVLVSRQLPKAGRIPITLLTALSAIFSDGRSVRANETKIRPAGAALAENPEPRRSPDGESQSGLGLTGAARCASMRDIV